MTGATSDQALEQAMSFLMDLQEAPDDPSVRDQLAHWLAADTAHGVAWDKARRVWALSGELDPVHGDLWERQVPTPAAAVVPFARRRSHMGWTVAAASIAACLALLLAPSVLLSLRADHVTATAELRDVTLPDGSAVRLGARSAIAIDYADARRDVTLLEGEAWFDVAHEPARPFTVHAGGVDTTVLGTAFEVQKRDDATIVAVARGRVGVHPDAAGQPALDERLEPGDRVTVDPAGGVRRDRVPLDQVASWRDGHLFADNATVADMVGRLRRYESGWIVIADDSLGQRRVTGLYDPTRMEAALRALVQTGGGRVRRVTPFLYVLSAS